MGSVLTFLATFIVVVVTCVFAFRAAQSGAWLTVIAVLTVGVFLMWGLQLLVSRRDREN